MILERKNRLVSNLLWLFGSLLLAFIVWMTADFDANPIVQRSITSRIPIEVLTDENVAVTNNPVSRALVVVRAQEDTFNELTEDDLRLFVDLRGTEEFGSREVEVQWEFVDKGSALVQTISPPRIRVDLEPLQERLVELEATVSQDPPASVEADLNLGDLNQIRVSGPVDDVAQVQAAQVSLDLSDVRQSQEMTAVARAVDAEGAPVPGVTVIPQEIVVQVTIRERSDVDEIRIRPNLVGEPPEGYTLTPRFSYEPDTVIISGPPELLETLPGTLSTQPIDLSQYTADFEISVPLDLPSDDLLLITGQRITVRVGIAPIITSRQFENIPIEVIGLRDGLRATLSPESVSVLVNGPQPVISTLQPGDVRVLVDLNEFTEATTTQMAPTASVASANLEDEGVSVLPPTMDVVITEIDDSETP